MSDPSSGRLKVRVPTVTDSEHWFFEAFILGPSISNAGQICGDVLEDIRPYAIMYEEVKELYNILREVMKEHGFPGRSKKLTGF